MSRVVPPLTSTPRSHPVRSRCFIFKVATDSRRMPVYRKIMNIPISRGRPRLITASTNASINVASGTPGGDVRWSFGRSSFSTGFVGSRSRFTSHRQKLESVDCRTRMVLKLDCLECEKPVS
jgi:hypothetical protein